MRSFTKSLNHATNEIDKAIQDLKGNESNLDDRFDRIRLSATRSLIRRSGPSKPNDNIPRLPKRIFSPSFSQVSPLSSKEVVWKFRGGDSKNPTRYFSSPAGKRATEEEIHELEELKKYPNPSIAPLYRPKIDQFLHVGTFESTELAKSEQSYLQS